MDDINVDSDLDFSIATLLGLNPVMLRPARHKQNHCYILNDSYGVSRHTPYSPTTDWTITGPLVLWYSLDISLCHSLHAVAAMLHEKLKREYPDG